MAKPWRTRLLGSRALGLAICIGLLATLGILGIGWNRTNTRTVEEARRTEAAQALTDTTAHLVQGLQKLSTALGAFGTSRTFSERRNDPEETAALRDFVQNSPYFTFGAEVYDISLQRTSRYMPRTTPYDLDPAYGPMVSGIPIPPSGGPTSSGFGLLSGALDAAGHPVIAIGVLLYNRNVLSGTLIGYVDLAAPNIQSLLFAGRRGPLDAVTVFDSLGTVVAGTDTGKVGARVDGVLRDAGSRAALTQVRFDTTVNGRPGIGFATGDLPSGWVAAGTVGNDALYGSARGRGLLINLAMVVMVAFTALILVVTSLRADKNLRRSEERFRGLVQHGNDVIAVVDRTGTLIYVSPNQQAVLQYTKETDYRGVPAIDYIHPDDREAVLAMFARVLAEPAVMQRGEFRLRRADGEYRWMDVHFTNMTNSAVRGIVINSRDVTDSRALREQLRDQATQDALTGLANRRLLYQRLTAELGAPDHPVAVLYVDLDRFKPVNDRLGHEAGDALLCHAAERLRRCIRPSDLLARVGGDEFVVVAPDLRAEDADALARRVVDTLATPFAVAGDPDVRIGASVGVGFGWAPDLPDEVLRRADAAMYRAKEAGGHRMSTAR
jgi:diguanylate cyclase (GGDEF)-like protein/PAS domain S-box-containing protein